MWRHVLAHSWAKSPPSPFPSPIAVPIARPLWHRRRHHRHHHRHHHNGHLIHPHPLQPALAQARWPQSGENSGAQSSPARMECGTLWACNGTDDMTASTRHGSCSRTPSRKPHLLVPACLASPSPVRTKPAAPSPPTGPAAAASPTTTGPAAPSPPTRPAAAASPTTTRPAPPSPPRRPAAPAVYRKKIHTLSTAVYFLYLGTAVYLNSEAFRVVPVAA